MPRITITRNTVCAGVDVFVGQEIDADERDARLLLAMGKAVPSAVQTRTDDEQSAMITAAKSQWADSEELQKQFPDVADYLEHLQQ